MHEKVGVKQHLLKCGSIDLPDRILLQSVTSWTSYILTHAVLWCLVSVFTVQCVICSLFALVTAGLVVDVKVRSVSEGKL